MVTSDYDRVEEDDHLEGEETAAILNLKLPNPHQLSLNTSDEPLSLICPYYRDCLGIGMRYLIAKQLVSVEPYSISHDITCQHYTKCNIIAYSHDFKK